MAEESGTVICRPDLALWIDQAANNRSSLMARPPSPLSFSDIQYFRKKVYEKAAHFTKHSLNEQIDALLVYDEKKVLIAAGHQPVVYHSGVARKNRLLSEALSGGGAIGINVIIDTDVGSAARLSFPKISGSSAYELGERVLSHGGSVYASQRIFESAKLREIFTEIKSCVLPVILPELERIEEQYYKSAGESAVIAQTRIRRHFESNPQYLELPLTELIAIPEAGTFLTEIIIRGADFQRHFNEQLDTFRLDRKIKNHANPFPNLESRDHLIELPFWIVDRISGSRSALYLKQDTGDLVDTAGAFIGAQCDAASLFDWSQTAQFRLAPRALLITALLRALCSDYFVHGLGGERYDAFLDRLFESYWQIRAPSFAVVSETRYLFPDLVRKLDENEKLLSSAREIQFHLDNYLNNGTFPEEFSRSLKLLWNQRTAFRDKLIEIKRSGGLAAETTQSMKAIDAEIKSALGTFFSSRALPSATAIDALRWREFPFMYFQGVKHEHLK